VKVRIPEGPIVHRWITDAILPVAGRFLCWVDCYQGSLVVDVPLANDEGPAPQMSSSSSVTLRCRKKPCCRLTADIPTENAPTLLGVSV